MNFTVEARGPAGPQPITRFRLEQIVVLGFEAWWTGSFALVAESHFSQDVVFVNHCPKHMNVVGGRHQGPAAVVAAFQNLVAELSPSDPCVTNILTDGIHVAVSYSVGLKHVGTGRSGRVAGMSHVTIDTDFRIKHAENFFDSAAMAEIGDMLEDFAARSEALDRVRRYQAPPPRSPFC